MVIHLATQGGLSFSRPVRLWDSAGPTYYRPLVDWACRDAAVIEVLTTLGTTKPRRGFWKYVDQLWLTGYRWNHKRLWRVYCRLRLDLPRRTKKRLPVWPVAPDGPDPTAQCRVGTRLHG